MRVVEAIPNNFYLRNVYYVLLVPTHTEWKLDQATYTVDWIIS